MSEATGVARSTRADRVLVLCSANQCRSPMAGAFLRREAQIHGLAVDVMTAGFGTPGQPATGPTLEAAATLGIDLDHHVSRTVNRELLVGADLVVGMGRQHVREAVLLERSVWPRSFTLLDLVRRAESVPARVATEAFRTWVELLGVGRDRSSLLGASADDDIRDPTTEPGVDHHATAELLDDLVRRFVTRAWPAT